MRILFSPIGGSDPIKRMLDGPMLHCCRVYKPDIVYIYLTKEMLSHENTDGRYTYVINKLGEKLNHKFEIVKIEKPELSEVQLFDSFYDEFEEIYTKIEEKYPDAEMYFNASSGTPAIKSALVITAAMSNRNIKVIQVSSGEKKPLHDRDSDDKYDIQEQWECDIDNDDEFTDRTTIVESPKFLVKVKKDNIRKFIEAYDYSAARALSEEIKDYFNDGTYELICAADERVKLNYNGVKKELNGLDYNIIPEISDKKRDITEYLLWLGVTLKKHDYLGFIRGITPAAMAIMESTVENKTQVGDIKNYCDNENGHYKLTADNLRKTSDGLLILNCLDEKFRKGFRDSEYSTAHLEAIIGGFCNDEKIKKYANIIRNAENEIRNPAAHSITSVSDELIKRKIGITAEELYDVIKSISVRIGLVKKDVWNSYDEMNSLILNKL